MTSSGYPISTLSAAEVKDAARGRWVDILGTAGLHRDLLDGRGHPCPKCNGKDRFSAFGDVADTGGVMCRKCFDKHCGDGLATIRWLHDCSFPDAVKWVADCVGLAPIHGKTSTDIVAEVAAAKRIPMNAFLKFGVTAAKRGKKSVARVPVYNETGEVHSYFDLTATDKGWFKKGKGNSGLFFPGRLPEPGERWLLVEGVKDAAALVSLGYLAAGLPRNEMDAKYAPLFSGCEIVVVPDLDSAGMNGSVNTSGRLFGIAKEVLIARLPGDFVERDGADVRDVIAKYGEQAVRTAVESASTWQAVDDPEDPRPTVIISDDEAAVAEEVVSHLAASGWCSPQMKPENAERSRVYQRGGVLVHVVCDPKPLNSGVTLPDGVPRIRTLPKPLVRERISQAVRLFEKRTKDGEEFLVSVRPPEWLVPAIHQRGEFGPVRMLAGVIRTPTLRPDGTVIQERGYDTQTGLLFLPDCKFPEVPASPTLDDAVNSAATLSAVVSDFPFTSEAHISIWLATVLTQLARPAINGPCPLFAFDANTRGSGKSLLADVAGIIATGSAMARSVWTGSDKEVQKVITSIALEGWPTVLFDNVASVLGGPALEAALTGTTWQDRILGKSKTTGLLPLMTVWLASGNNIQLTGDTARRTLMCRLESLEEHPEDRSDFLHPDLKEHVRQHRPELAVAGLTLLRAYFAASCPKMEIAEWGSFEAWSDLIRHALVWAGRADPWLTRESMRDADRSADLIRALYTGIEEADVTGSGLTSSEIARLLDKPFSDDRVDPNSTLRVSVEEICGRRKINSSSIGFGLRKFKGRVCAGKRLGCRPGHGGVNRWFVEAVAPAGGDGGHGGDQINHPRVEPEEHTYVF